MNELYKPPISTRLYLSCLVGFSVFVAACVAAQDWEYPASAAKALNNFDPVTDYWWDVTPYHRCDGPLAGQGPGNAASRLTEELAILFPPEALNPNPLVAQACVPPGQLKYKTHYINFNGLSGPYSQNGPLYQSNPVPYSGGVYCFPPSQLQWYLDQLVIAVQTERQNLPADARFVAAQVDAYQAGMTLGQHRNYHGLNITYVRPTCEGTTPR